MSTPPQKDGERVAKPPVIEVALTPQHIGELAALSQTAAAGAFADGEFNRAARHYRAAAKLCAALSQHTTSEGGSDS